jgi:zinc/manganese transport system substrate-binding protein
MILGTATSMAGEPVKIVASFSILGDMAKIIGGDHVRVETLVGPEQDAHVFEPSPLDAARVAQADLVILNGLGFEGWMERLVGSSGRKQPVVIASDGIVPRRMDNQARPSLDPHAWQNVANARLYAANIAKALIAADPSDEEAFRSNLSDYDAALAVLDQEIRSVMSAIPQERRKIVTTHDAFGYFSEAYGLELLSPVGVSTEAEPSAKDIARIIRLVRTEHVPAIFLETISDPRLANQIATETGAKIGGTLYSDALSRENGPAGSYIAMMKTNIRELTKALSP